MSSSEMAEGVDMVESTNLKYFGKEMVAEFMALKGAFLAQIGRSEEANKAFSSAVQLHDNLAKSWALWGDYLDQLFTKDRCVLWLWGVCGVWLCGVWLCGVWLCGVCGYVVCGYVVTCSGHITCLVVTRNLTLGVSALTCYLHACRNQSEPKCRKYLARIIWMLTYDDEKVRGLYGHG